MTAGFNLDSKCEKKGCSAFEKPVVVKFGMGKFNIKKCQLKACCPMGSAGESEEKVELVEWGYLKVTTKPLELPPEQDFLVEYY